MQQISGRITAVFTFYLIHLFTATKKNYKELRGIFLPLNLSRNINLNNMIKSPKIQFRTECHTVTIWWQHLLHRSVISSKVSCLKKTLKLKM